ncbi:hypothetical protein SEA_MERCEDES_44 [Microbacterium phage Mercedes]|nr:hypothetical protein SEA_MERCEDES_44 [Microbacterium phage Mercedes]
MNNIWEFVWTALGWGCAVLVVVGFLILAFAALAILWGVVRSWFKPKVPDRKMLLNNAEAAAISRYRLEANHGFVGAFREGAEYAWDRLHPTKQK